MKTIIDKLPEELIEKIYQCIFADCLIELIKNYSRDWINKPGKYTCIDCSRGGRKAWNMYPNNPQIQCHQCSSFLCYAHYIIHKKRSESLEYVQLCGQCLRVAL